MPIDAVGASGLYTPQLQVDGDSSAGPALAAPGASAGAEPTQPGSGFAEALGNVIAEANRDQVDATRKALDLVVNGRGTIHDAMVAVDNAEGSFRLLMEMRNRLIEGVNRLLETQL